MASPYVSKPELVKHYADLPQEYASGASFGDSGAALILALVCEVQPLPR